jgi:UDP-N-acetylglucosamine acyltransferase
VYRLIYQSSLNVTQASERVDAELPASEEREVILNFVKNSSRGIIKGYSD